MAYLGESIGKLGFGLMRLPQKEDGAIDVEQTKEMVDLLLEAGFTYFDTAWAYAGSEDAIRQALVERYPRESFQLATKNAAWINCKTREEAIAQFDTSLKQTGAGYFDFYLLHNLGEGRTHFFDDFDLWNFVQEKKAEGLIRHAGFSFHAGPEELDEILTKHPEMEFVQLQINYLDWDSAKVQSAGVYEVARKHNKPIIIMEPVKGGLLANLQSDITKPFGSASPSSMALRFAAGLDGVLAVLSGMSTMEQLEENTKIFSPLEKLSDEEMKAIHFVKESIKKLQVIECTACGYCLSGCPKKIAIPDIFKLLNEEAVMENKDGVRNRYSTMIKDGKSGAASSCIRCGKCERVCPQKLPIRDLLRTAENLL